MLSFVGEVARAAVRLLSHPGRIRWRTVLYNVRTAGFDALPITGLLCFLMGIVIAYQGATQLAPVAVQLPPTVVLEVIETPPELKGGTATKRPKPARLNTGLEIMVPEYIVNGEKIHVSTTTGEFNGRA